MRKKNIKENEKERKNRFKVHKLFLYIISKKIH